MYLKDKKDNQYKYIIGGIHAKNGEKKEKWSQIFNQLKDIKNTNELPMIIYIDINYDTHSEEYR